jgi:anti-sigma regulatory factor (Ser/Thr protein kinase)
MTMVHMELSSFDDVRAVRRRVGDLARAAGLHDPEAAVMAAAELGNNCVEHGGGRSGLLRIGCRPGRLSLHFQNPCEHCPDWRTRKLVAVAGFRTGGYGLEIVRVLARTLNCRWKDGRLVVRAEFD